MGSDGHCACVALQHFSIERRFGEARFYVQDTADVRCGVPFQLLVQPYDRFGNR